MAARAEEVFTDVGTALVEDSVLLGGARGELDNVIPDLRGKSAGDGTTVDRSSSSPRTQFAPPHDVLPIRA
ncbi:MAG: hypothetical protein P4L93_04545 [Coriobacteriia bacterium]|nr:hypothetical protein [Coriobacteriia bacterium]